MSVAIDRIEGLTAEQRALLRTADADAPSQADRNDGRSSAAELDAYVNSHANLALTGAQIHDLRGKLSALELPRGVPRDLVLTQHYFNWPKQTTLDVLAGGKVIGTIDEYNAWTPFARIGMEWRGADGKLIAKAHKLNPLEAMKRMITKGRVGDLIQIDDADGKPIGRLVERYLNTIVNGHTQTRYEVWVADASQRSGYRLAAYSNKTQVQNARTTTVTMNAADNTEAILAQAQRGDSNWWWSSDHYRDRWRTHTLAGPHELHPAFIVFSAAFKTERGDASTTTQQ